MVGIAIATWRTGKEEDKVGKSVKNFIFFDSSPPRPRRALCGGRCAARRDRAGAAAGSAEEAEQAEQEPRAGWPAPLLPAGDFPAWALTPRTSLRQPRTMGDKGTR